jgi:CcmD family protein
VTRRLTSLLITGVVLVTGWATTLSAQVDQQGEFLPVAPGELQEQLPAAPLVFAAYGIVWLVFAFYLFSIWKRVRQVEAELRVVTAKLEKDGR